MRKVVGQPAANATIRCDATSVEVLCQCGPNGKVCACL